MSSASQSRQSAGSRVLELLDRIDYRLVESVEDREEIYRLRYRAYLREGAISPNPDNRVTDRFDEMPNSWTFGVFFDGMLVSSVRISVSSPAYPLTPSTDVFADMLAADMQQGKVMVDPTRFVADPDEGKRFPELPYLTLRLAYIACSYFNADIGLATVRVEHQAFYQRVFLHQPKSPPRLYPGLVKPICLMAVDFPKMRDTVFARYPVFRSSQFERRMLFERRPALPQTPAAGRIMAVL